MAAYTSTIPSNYKFNPTLKPWSAFEFSGQVTITFTKVPKNFSSETPITNIFSPSRQFSKTIGPQFPVNTTIPKLP